MVILTVSQSENKGVDNILVNLCQFIILTTIVLIHQYRSNCSIQLVKTVTDA